MALSANLFLRQSQSLVMTPQLMQAIKLLQLSNMELVAYVEADEDHYVARAQYPTMNAELVVWRPLPLSPVDEA